MLRISFCLGLLLVSLGANAGSLDAPGTKVVTVKSEIFRGEQAAFQASVTAGMLSFSNTIDRIDDENTQKGTDSHGFLLGLHYRAWQSLWPALSAGYFKGAELNLAVLLADTNHKIYLAQRKFLDLSPEQVKECDGAYGGQAEDAVWERALASKNFLGTCPHTLPRR